MSPATRPAEERGEAAPTPELSVVIPVYNEAENVGPLHREIRRALDGGARYEILFVDDASDDGTAQALLALRTADPTVRVLHHRTNGGQSAALRTGFEHARAPWVATLDGDGQNDPADLPRMLAVLRDPARAAGLELVCGHRARRRDSWLRRISSRLTNFVRSRILGDGSPDTGCGLKLVRRDAFLSLPNFAGLHRFLPALIQHRGGRVVSIEVNHRPRIHGVSKYGVHNRLWVGIADLLGVLWLRSRARHPRFQELE